MYDMKDKNVVVVGLGKSGVSACRYCALKGARVFASDLRSAKELGDSISSIKDVGVHFSLGKNDESLFLNAALVVISPGVSLDLPGLREAMEREVPIVGEMELAISEIKKPIVAVTGTNGKTTTTSLIGHLLEASGIKHVVGGNIGKPVIDMIDDANGSECAVLEVSSFQIDTTPSLKPQIGVLLNISQDHLDRHKTMDSYVASKAKLFHQMAREGVGIYNAADDRVSQSILDAQCVLIPFDATGRILSRKKGKRACFDDGDLIVKINGDEHVYSMENVSLRGLHNRENMLAAICAALLCGADSAEIQSGLRSFKALAHRMEFVAEIEGVKYFNDSKGTNVGAVIRALEDCAEPVVLIAGGVSKGADFSGLKKLVRERVKHLILIGESASEMERTFENCTSITHTRSMDEAVKKACQFTQPGDVVLLSPACASFDMFDDYAHRGRAFVNAVEGLKKSEGC
jgi:UDP-N-acetylmuramoylalanine--D-glutamate ligase